MNRSAFRWLKAICLFFLGIVLVTGCQNTTKVTRPELPQLMIGYNSWTGNFPLAIAREKGFFAQRQLTLETRYSESLNPMLADFAAGKLDGMLLPLGDLILVSKKNPNIRAVAMIDESTEADAVVALANIQSVADLKGKRIGVILGSYGELFVTKMLEANGLNTNDVSLVSVEGSLVPLQLKSQTIQAGHTWEPYISQTVKTGAKVLFTGKQTPGLIPDVFAFQARVLRDRPNDVRAFLQAWFQAVDYWQANPQESSTLIAKIFKIDPKSASNKGVKFFSLNDNRTIFKSQNTNSNTFYQTVKLYNDFFIRTGSLDKPVDIRQLFNASFLEPKR